MGLEKCLCIRAFLLAIRKGFPPEERLHYASAGQEVISREVLASTSK